MGSDTAFDRTAVAGAIENLLLEREMSWILSADIVIRFARAHVPDKHAPMQFGQYIVYHLAVSNGGVVHIRRLGESANDGTTRAVFYVGPDSAPCVLAQVVVRRDESRKGKALNALAQGIANLLTALTLPLTRPSPDEMYVWEPPERVIRVWRVVYSMGYDIPSGTEIRNITTWQKFLET